MCKSLALVSFDKAKACSAGLHRRCHEVLMGQALDVHRLHFAFTITFHYLFPQLTMGLALLLVYLKTKALRTGDEHYHRAARFWARIFGINFALGVVTGIPMEFQFGTNWAGFSKTAGGVIGQTLAMEGIFSFFLESSFLGLFLRLRARSPWTRIRTGLASNDTPSDRTVKHCGSALKCGSAFTMRPSLPL